MTLTPKARRLIDAAQRERGVDRRALYKCPGEIKTVKRLIEHGLLRQVGRTVIDATYHTTDAGKVALSEK